MDGFEYLIREAREEGSRVVRRGEKGRRWLSEAELLARLDRQSVRYGREKEGPQHGSEWMPPKRRIPEGE